MRSITGPPDDPDPTFNFEFMKSKSMAAAGLCDWVVNSEPIALLSTLIPLYGQCANTRFRVRSLHLP